MNRPTPLLIALAALMLSSAGFPQDTPAPAKSEAARPQGPVDNDNPVVRPRPAPSITNNPAAVPATTPASPVAASSAPAAARAKPSPAPTSTPSAKQGAKDKGQEDKDRQDNNLTDDNPDEAAARQPVAEEASAAASAVPVASAQGSTAPAAAIGKPQAPGLTMSFPFPLDGQLVPGIDNRFLAGLLALAMLLVAVLLPARFGGEQSRDETDDNLAESPDPAEANHIASEVRSSVESEDPALSDASTGQAPAVMPAGEVAEVSAPVELSLDPVKLSATLIAATLNYRLEVTNLADFPLENLAIGGGMISAHASLPVDHQLGTDGQLLTLLHRIPLLAPGATAEVTGDLRLPLNEITPVRSGDALLFIPIARFRVEVMNGDATSAWVIGETPPVAAAALLPFRIDLGPRIWTRVSKRLLGPVTKA